MSNSIDLWFSPKEEITIPLFTLSTSKTVGVNSFNIVLTCTYTSQKIIVLESKRVQQLHSRSIGPALSNSSQYVLKRNNTDSLIYQNFSNFDTTLKRITLATHTREKSTQTINYFKNTFELVTNNVINELKEFSRKNKIDFVIQFLTKCFPKSLILKCVIEYRAYLITAIHPKPWDKAALFFALRIKIRGGIALYRHLRDFFHFPLPCERTLNLFVEKIICSPGIQYHELSRLASILPDATQFEKYFVLILDEMSIEKIFLILGNLNKYLAFLLYPLEKNSIKQIIYLNLLSELLTYL